MQIKRLEINKTIGIKNTFLNKAKNSRSMVNRNYWESLHYEAKSRLNYIKFKNAEQDLMKTDEKPIPLIKAFAKMAYRKIMSGIYEGKAYSKFPHRFYEPDNTINAGEERFYKINLHKRLV